MIGSVNLVTRWLVVGPFVAWACWEVALVILRAKYGTQVRLVSQVAESLAFRGLGALAYFMAGLSAHFFATWTRPTWSGTTATILGLVFWLVGVAYLVADLLDPARAYWPLWAQWVRWPPVIAALGALLAWSFFPQRALWVPGGIP